MAEYMKILLDLLCRGPKEAGSESLGERDLSEAALHGLVIKAVKEMKQGIKGSSQRKKNLYLAMNCLQRGLEAMEIQANDPTQDTEDWAASMLETCREDAMKAFDDKSLSVQNRILAVKMNICSMIVAAAVSQGTPQIAGRSCWTDVLGDLHAGVVVKRAFQRYYEGSNWWMKFWRGYAWEFMVNSVIQINRAVYDFLLLNQVTVDRWPAVQAGERTYVPLRTYRCGEARCIGGYQTEVSEEGGVRWMSPDSLAEVNRRRQLVLVYSRQKLVVEDERKLKVRLLNLDTAEVDKEFHHDRTDHELVFCSGITVDEHDNIYLGLFYGECTQDEGRQKCSLGLFVEVYTHEFCHLRTLTVVPMADTADNSLIMSSFVCLSAAYGRLVVTNERDLWVFGENSDRATKHKVLSVDVRKCWIHGERIILGSASSEYVVLDSYMEVERTFNFSHIYWRTILDKTTGLFLGFSEDGLAVLSFEGERFHTIRLLGYERCFVLPSTLATQAGLLLVKRKNNHCESHRKLAVISLRPRFNFPHNLSPFPFLRVLKG